MDDKSVPDDIILEILSHMKSREIIEYCKTDRRINNICKNNRVLLTKYILKNHWGFTNFPYGYDYISIMKYMTEKWDIYFMPESIYNYSKMLPTVVKDNRMDVLQFLIANGAKVYNDTVSAAIVYNNYYAFRYFIEQLGIDITDEENEFIFEDLCTMVFTHPDVYQHPEILDYIIKNYRQYITRDYLENLYEILLEEGSIPLADYVQLLIDSDEPNTVQEFLENYMD